MSKFHIYCSCAHCKLILSTQNLNQHYNTHFAVPKNSCKLCNAPTNNMFCSRSCSAKYNNKHRDTATYAKISVSNKNKSHKNKKQTLIISYCQICNQIHHSTSKTCSKECKAALLSLKMKERIYNGFNPNNNRGRGKQSYLEKSFENWLNLNFPTLPYITEYPIKRLDMTKTYFADFYFPTLQFIIELDGSQHNTTIEYDSNRDNYINSTYGFRILRVTHTEYKNKVKEKEIWSILSESN